MLSKIGQSNCSRKLPKTLENDRNSNFLSLLSLSSFKVGVKFSECDGMEWGSCLIYRRQQPITIRLVAARVSARMAPVTFAAAPRAPHGNQHGQPPFRSTLLHPICQSAGLECM